MLGDYFYRESACPAGNAGCAGSPWGNNWTTWQADFYTPAAPLLSAAPIVLVRGNHEDCKRSGSGFQLLMGPGDAVGPCQVHEPLYRVDLGGLTLGVLDDAVSEETELDRTLAQTYADEIASLAQISTPVWLVHHRPTWAAITGPLGIAMGGNLTLMEGSRLNAQKGAALIPHSVELMLSGHIHTFEAINFNQPVPPQIVAGNGGDALYVTPRNLRGTHFLGHSGVTVKDGLSVGGFGFLLMTPRPATAGPSISTIRRASPRASAVSPLLASAGWIAQIEALTIAPLAPRPDPARSAAKRWETVQRPAIWISDIAAAPARVLRPARHRRCRDRSRAWPDRSGTACVRCATGPLVARPGMTHRPRPRHPIGQQPHRQGIAGGIVVFQDAR